MLLTVDIGTSNCKAAVWDFHGGRIAFISVPLSMHSGEGPRHEAESGQWIAAFADCCRLVRDSSGSAVPLAAIEAVVVSGNGPSLTPVLGEPELGGNGLTVPAAPARLWLDRRAVRAAEQVSAAVGGFVDASFYLPKALDIKINESRLYEQTKHFMGCPELLVFALTGRAWTVFPSDGFDRWFWNDAVLERLDLDRGKFPPFIRPGDTFGGLNARAASWCGLRPHIPVIAGGPDFFAAILGSGAVRPGQACDRAGTSEGINTCTEQRITDSRLMSYCHPVKPFWNLSGIVSTTGKAIEWGRNLLGLESFEELMRLAESARPGAEGLVFLPYLAGERAPVWNPAARGILRGLSLSSGRPELARSILEGVCFAIRDIVEIMEETGAAVTELHITGGVSGGALLNQIKADITGKPMLVPRHKEAELLGLAIIGSCALGKYASFAEAASALVHSEQTYYPDAHNAGLYRELFEKYRQLRSLEQGGVSLDNKP